MLADSAVTEDEESVKSRGGIQKRVSLRLKKKRGRHRSSASLPTSTPTIELASDDYRSEFESLGKQRRRKTLWVILSKARRRLGFQVDSGRRRSDPALAPSKTGLSPATVRRLSSISLQEWSSVRRSKRNRRRTKRQLKTLYSEDVTEIGGVDEDRGNASTSTQNSPSEHYTSGCDEDRSLSDPGIKARRSAPTSPCSNRNTSRNKPLRRRSVTMMRMKTWNRENPFVKDDNAQPSQLYLEMCKEFEHLLAPVRDRRSLEVLDSPLSRDGSKPAKPAKPKRSAQTSMPAEVLLLPGSNTSKSSSTGCLTSDGPFLRMALHGMRSISAGSVSSDPNNFLLQQLSQPPHRHSVCTGPTGSGSPLLQISKPTKPRRSLPSGDSVSMSGLRGSGLLNASKGSPLGHEPGSQSWPDTDGPEEYRAVGWESSADSHQSGHSSEVDTDSHIQTDSESLRKDVGLEPSQGADCEQKQAPVLIIQDDSVPSSHAGNARSDCEDSDTSSLGGPIVVLRVNDDEEHSDDVHENPPSPPLPRKESVPDNDPFMGLSGSLLSQKLPILTRQSSSDSLGSIKWRDDDESSTRKTPQRSTGVSQYIEKVACQATAAGSSGITGHETLMRKWSVRRNNLRKQSLTTRIIESYEQRETLVARQTSLRK